MDFATRCVEQSPRIESDRDRRSACLGGPYSRCGELRTGLFAMKRVCERSSARVSEKVSVRLASFGLNVMKSPIVSAANAGSLQEGAERGSGGRSRMPGRASVRLQCFPVCWRQVV